MTDGNIRHFPGRHGVARQQENIETMASHTAIYMIALQSPEAFLQALNESGGITYTSNISHAGRFSRKQAGEMQEARPNVFENAVLVLAPEFNSAIGECFSIMNETARCVDNMMTETMFLLRATQNEDAINSASLWQALLDMERAQQSAVNLFSSVAIKTIKRLCEDEGAGQ